METMIQCMDATQFKESELEKASEILRAGGLVAFPTETVYGLGGDAFNKDAARRIYEAKGRPSDNPLIVHIADIEDLEILAREVPVSAKKLAEVFWPGPLTMILKKSRNVPDSTTGGLNTVAIRMPSHPIARSLIAYSGIKIAAPSANISGRPSPTLAKHVIEDLEGKIDLILDAGSVTIGLESTIIDLSQEIPTVLRPGSITIAMLKKVISNVVLDQAFENEKSNTEYKPKAPGMKYKHYAPKGDVIIYKGNLKKVVYQINQDVLKYELQGKKVGILVTEETKSLYGSGCILSIGSRKDEASIAHSLYAVLREFDERGIDLILAESFYSDDLGIAIMNRLLKAASYHVEEVS